MDRRNFVAGALLTTIPVAFAGNPEAGGSMSPNEDLMQEHALLNRVLLIYEESIRRLTAGVDLDPDVLKRAAQIIQVFVEQYHEKLEEDHVFPRFERAGQLTELTPVLRDQHAAGRVVTQAVIDGSTLVVFRDPTRRDGLVEQLRKFLRMYRPHEAREGTVLFPALRQLLPAAEFNDLGDMFERLEHQILGEEGFEGQVEIVAGLERQLGIYDLAQFTPH
jgi:hemerythrin-like domain-containing protein